MSRSTAPTSPSIPTPSISASPQAADGAPNEAFEALIDLLASDGIDDAPPASAVPRRARSTSGGAVLRDASGRLDFEKICSMFEGQNLTASQGGAPVGSIAPDQQVPDSLGESVKTGVDDRRDCQVENAAALQENPVTSTVQDSVPDRNGRPDGDNTFHSNDAPRLPDVLTTPFSFDQLNDALDSAHDEMRTLHRQYDELRTLVAERFGKGKKLGGLEQKMTQKVEREAQVKDSAAPSDLRVPDTTAQNGAETGSQIVIEGSSDHDPKQGGDDNLATEIARLSEEDAKRALTAIASMTNVRPSLLLSEDFGSAPSKLSPRTRGNLGLQDISRALDFVERVDEIVWRRSSIPINSSLDPVFSAGNVEGLLSRLELWERMVRRSSV
ncbi:hypothetical protein BKA82DRAFT_1001075 [Pisolithus tinctorius]|uniref:Uncharacterized protein n=1 Tax=Pisolithus tinctorius Marx 270 TaxID=870435 RepID=A0A0C3NSR2_PISTI|nr:hypothetical protein BKA82DRAFT_4211458 [Pisolithus tinctorius]KAI6144609.1 hypothetical protein BKA82DRAFT_1001075 [Pisolithus tinctorius]KIO03905.1 hypothetical protein M404DRAFT_1001075 [Pisolithus tinctorius Marx 270]